MSYAFLTLLSLAGANSTAQFALVIGYNRADLAHVAPLKYADDDAIAMHHLFSDAGVQSVLLVDMDGDTRALHPTVVNFGTPSKNNVEAAFRRLRGEMSAALAEGGDVDFFFYYSGHGGVEHGEGYVTLAEGRLLRGELYETILAQSPATHNHVLIDACKSYFMAFEKGTGGERTTYVKHFAAPQAASLLANTGLVLSTSSHQDSHEWERFGSGIFSHELRSALRGAADVDADAHISYAELGAFLTVANASIANERYRPRFLVRAPGQNAAAVTATVLSWASGLDTLVLEGNSPPLHLESALGERILDAPPLKAAARLYLPSQRPIFIRSHHGDSEYLLAHSGSARFSALRAGTATLRPKGALHLAFEQLFTAPFGTAEVANYVAAYGALGDPLQVASAVGTDEPSFALRKIAMWSTVGALVLGAAAQAWAWQTHTAAQNASQLERERLNEKIVALNVGAFSAYGLAAAAGATWIGLLFSEDAEP